MSVISGPFLGTPVAGGDDHGPSLLMFVLAGGLGLLHLLSFVPTSTF